jgi:hypothetical protein
LRFFFRSTIPPFRRVLLVESGGRHLLEDILPGICGLHQELERCDIVTCFPGVPRNFDPARGRVYRVADYAGREGRKRLYKELGAADYSILGIICSGEAIMTKWKWVLAWKLRAKLFVLNENCDYFWCDRTNLGIMKNLALYRAGLAGEEGLATLARLALLPFTLTYLLLFAGVEHWKRRQRR